MIWTAWNNGKNHPTGAGYGLKVSIKDRDRHFNRAWQTVLIQLPTGDLFETVEVNVAKDSFWGPTCRELISGEIGRWLLSRQFAPWPNGTPPRFEVEPLDGPRFQVKGILTD